MACDVCINTFLSFSQYQMTTQYLVTMLLFLYLCIWFHNWFIFLSWIIYWCSHREIQTGSLYSLRVQLIVVLVSTFITALYCQSTSFQLGYKSCCSPYVLEMVGAVNISTVVAIQFVIDQLEGTPSEVLSAFVYWYFMTERYQWIYYNIILKWSFASPYMGLWKLS